LSTRPIRSKLASRILGHVACVRTINEQEEVNQLPNPLAIGVTIGGLLLDVIVPRPKPRASVPRESSLLSARTRSRTPWKPDIDPEYDGRSVRVGFRS
jgi:hypothetical protein